MQEKVIFVINNLEIGGIQKALISYLETIQSIYEITLLCINKKGQLADKIPKNIKVIEGNNFIKLTEESYRETSDKSKVLGVVSKVLRFWTRLFGKRVPAWLLTNICFKIRGKYDAAVSYSQPIEDDWLAVLTNEIVLYSIDSPKKITYVHCDFANYGGNTRYNRHLYTKFDEIIGVSKSVAAAFVSCCPSLSDKVKVQYNTVNKEEILKLSRDNPICYDRFAFVTVARLSEEKGIIRCVRAFNEVKKQGYVFEWHIIGDGPDKAVIDEEILKYGLSDDVILHGEQINPYRFLTNANYLLIPSYHEAAPLVIDEAKCLNKPILTTDTVSAKEMVEDCNAGHVCDNTLDGLITAIKKLIEESW